MYNRLRWHTGNCSHQGEGDYAGARGSGLRPSALLDNFLALVLELAAYANFELKVATNSNCGPAS
jgi:hypothetical protein